MNCFGHILSWTCLATYDCMNVRIWFGILGFSLRPKIVGHDRVAM